MIFSGVPEQVKQCSVVNEQISSLNVTCKPGFNGGLSQWFIAQVNKYILNISLLINFEDMNSDKLILVLLQNWK